MIKGSMHTCIQVTVVSIIIYKTTIYKFIIFVVVKTDIKALCYTKC